MRKKKMVSPRGASRSRPLRALLPLFPVFYGDSLVLAYALCVEKRE